MSGVNQADSDSSMSGVSISCCFPVNGRKSFEVGPVSDREIEENFKVVLLDRKNGQYLNPGIVAHLEYFHNTLKADHKMDENHENPFKNKGAYPALDYIADEKEDLQSIQES